MHIRGGGRIILLCVREGYIIFYPRVILQKGGPCSGQ